MGGSRAKLFVLACKPRGIYKINVLQAIACRILCATQTCASEIRQFFKLQDESQSLMRAAVSQMNLSARAYHRILKLARTIADLAGSEEIQSVHLVEGLQYRPKLMME